MKKILKCSRKYLHQLYEQLKKNKVIQLFTSKDKQNHSKSVKKRRAHNFCCLLAQQLTLLSAERLSQHCRVVIKSGHWVKVYRRERTLGSAI